MSSFIFTIENPCIMKDKPNVLKCQHSYAYDRKSVTKEVTERWSFVPSDQRIRSNQKNQQPTEDRTEGRGGLRETLAVLVLGGPASQLSLNLSPSAPLRTGRA